MPPKRQIILKKLKEYDTVWHPESTLVFKSSTDKRVIGRIEDNELIQIDEKTIELCEQWNFDYDENLIDNEDTEEVDESQENETVEEIPKPVVKEVEEIPKPVVKEVEEIPKPVVKETKQNKTENVTVYGVQVQKLSSAINDFQQHILINLEEMKLNYERIIKELETDLQNSKIECSDYKQKYDTLKVKFDGIKSLFS
jgi:hypothetical protein